MESDVMTTRIMEFPNNQKLRKFLITYTDRSGNLSGPHEFLFDPILESQKNARDNAEMIRHSWVSLIPANTKQLNVNFTLLLTYRAALSEIKYGINKELPDTELEFPPSTEVFAPVLGELSQKSTFTLPADTKYVTVQVTYYNGEKSEVIQFEPTVQ